MTRIELICADKTDYFEIADQKIRVNPPNLRRLEAPTFGIRVPLLTLALAKYY